MKSLFRYLLLVLISSISLSSFSTQLAQNPALTIRARIHAQLLGLNPSLRCEAVFSPPISTANSTRGLSRGITRGIQLKSNLAEKVEEFSKKFSEVIRIEFDLPYGKESDPKSFYFLEKDPYEGPEKMKIYKELGVQWSGSKSPDKVSTWMEFAQNFRAALERQKINPKDFLVPSLVFFRTTADNKKEYKAIDPLSDELPQGEGWIILNKDIEFNLPFPVILSMMREGKFPLLDALHDTAHFVSFLRFPKFTSSLRKGMETSDADISRGFKRRMYWLTESLSVLDPKGAKKNQRFLNSYSRSTDVRDIESIESELAQFSERKLLTYSYELARYFESQLRDVSGGESNPAEKWYYLSENFKMTAKDLLSEDLSNTKDFSIIGDLSRTYFQDGPVTLSANPKVMTNETSTFSFNTFVTSQKLLTLILSKDKGQTIANLDSMSRSEALSYLIKYTSRIEYLLTKPPITYQAWAEAFLKAKLDPEDPVAKMLLTIFGNNIVKNYYLGIGDKRAEP
ncbi:MAG: hypothetical protein AABY64_13215 [Bdellovibrionota bacterium]|mgnify:CR=1 FL=1